MVKSRPLPVPPPAPGSAAVPVHVPAWARSVPPAVLTALAIGVAVGCAASPAFAQAAGGGGDLTTFLQNVVNILTGTAGRLIAVIAICIVGIGALMGALSLRTAGGVLLGVMLIFSSAWIVTQIVGA